MNLLLEKLREIFSVLRVQIGSHITSRDILASYIGFILSDAHIFCTSNVIFSGSYVRVGLVVVDEYAQIEPRLYLPSSIVNIQTY
ncbi:MAG: hypothetical protein WCP92_08965 [bacterium]